jgi:hypothetical protein
MSEIDLYSIPDGGSLRKLDQSLEIVRRQKHEWNPALNAMRQDKLIERTGKKWGSKFYAEWTLPTLVAWIAEVIAEEGWSLRPGQPSEVDRILDRNVGLAAGMATATIRVVCDGRYVHAYPVAEH